MAKKKVRRKEFKGIKKYLTLRNLLIAALVIFIYLMFSNLAKAILFVAIFVPVGILSIKLTRLLPHSDIETLTSSSFFLGYLFGWPVGAFFGTVLGAYIWMTAYSLSQFVLLELFLNALTALMGYIFNVSLGWNFQLAYFVGMGIRNTLYFILGLAIGGDPIENTIHTVTAVITNMVLLPSVIFLLYTLATII